MEQQYVFKNYREEKPKEVGWYVWRLPHKYLEGVTIIFLAKYRSRGAGYEDVLSPEFDYWDGYRVLLPEGLIEWAEYDGDPPKSGHEVLEVEGVKLASCPFCKKEPELLYSGQHVTAGPIETKFWYLNCCEWIDGFGARFKDPVRLAKAWNTALKS